MKIKIINIGNSKGIRIPKSVLNDCGFKNDAEIQIKDKKLIVSPIKKARVGWAEEFEKNTKKNSKEDKVLIDFESLDNEWDENEWKW